MSRPTSPAKAPRLTVAAKAKACQPSGPPDCASPALLAVITRLSDLSGWADLRAVRRRMIADWTAAHRVATPTCDHAEDAGKKAYARARDRLTARGEIAFRLEGDCWQVSVIGSAPRLAPARR